MVLVTGEPGIGKTSLVTRFLADLDDGARVLFGTCDDLSIPRPLGPLRDLAGSVSPGARAGARRRRAAARDPDAADRGARAAAAADGARARGRALGRRRDARRRSPCSGAASARCPRCSCSPSAAARCRPATRCTRRSARSAPDDSCSLELAPLSEDAVASLAGDDADDVYAATGGNPFYVTELLASRAAAELPPLGRERGARARVAARRRRAPPRRARLGRAEPREHVGARRRHAGLAGGGGGAGAPAAARGRRRRYVRFRHELARNAIRSSIPIAARRRLHAEILEALLARGRRSGRHRPPRRGRGRGGRRRASTRSSPRAGRPRSSRTARRTPTTGAPPTSSTGCPPREQAAVLEELATAAYAVGRLDDAFAAIERAIAIHRALGDEAALGRCTRDPVALPLVRRRRRRRARDKALEAIAILEPLGESVELARAYSGVSQLAMLAEDAEQALELGRARARARDPARRRDHARARARQHRQREAPDATRTRPRALLEAHALADAVGRPARGDARARQPRLRPDVLGAGPSEALRYAQRALAYAAAHEVHTSPRTSRTVVAWLRLRARRVGRGRADHAARDRDRA